MIEGAAHFEFFLAAFHMHYLMAAEVAADLLDCVDANHGGAMGYRPAGRQSSDDPDERSSSAMTAVGTGLACMRALVHQAVAALSVPGLRWSMFIVVSAGGLIVTGPDYGREPLGSSAARHNARR